MSRALLAVACALSGAFGLWASLFVHVVWVFGIKGGYLNGGFFPLTPSVPVTLAGLALQSVLVAAPFVPPALLIGLMAGRRPWGLPLMALVWALLWFIGADSVAGLFAADFGTTWQVGEPFSELFYRPGLTPLAFCAGFFLFLWLAQRVLKPRT